MMMKHPLYTYDDGTEVTASSIRDGKAQIYTERFDKKSDTFFTAIISVPDGNVVSFCGFSEDEVEKMAKFYKELASDIIEYIMEKEGLKETTSA